MPVYSMHEAKNHLSKLIRSVQRGETGGTGCPLWDPRSHCTPARDRSGESDHPWRFRWGASWVWEL